MQCLVRILRLHECVGMQLLDRIMEGGLLEAFLDRGARFAPVLRDIPLIVVTNDQLGVLGARQYALKLLDVDNTEVTPWLDDGPLHPCHS